MHNRTLPVQYYTRVLHFSENVLNLCRKSAPKKDRVIAAPRANVKSFSLTGTLRSHKLRACVCVFVCVCVVSPPAADPRLPKRCPSKSVGKRERHIEQKKTAKGTFLGGPRIRAVIKKSPSLEPDWLCVRVCGEDGFRGTDFPVELFRRAKGPECR